MAWKIVGDDSVYDILNQITVLMFTLSYDDVFL